MRGVQFQEILMFRLVLCGRPQLHPFHATRCLPWVIVVFALVLINSPVAGLVVELSEKQAEIKLSIGDDLTIAWSSAAPGGLFEISLVDEAGTVLAYQLVAADERGVVMPTHVWGRTGIVGCDGTSLAQPEAYTYRDFQDASTFLVGRTFRLEVTRDGFVTLTRAVTLVKAERELFFFSDVEGCPRSCFELDETVYVTGLNVAKLGWAARFFVVSSPAPAVGDPLIDLRVDLDEPQRLPSGDFTAVVGPADRLGPDVVIGLGRTDDCSDEPIRLPGDKLSVMGKSHKNSSGDADIGPCRE